MKTYFSLLPSENRVSDSAAPLMMAKVRRPTTGKMLKHPLVLELHKLNDHIHLLGNEFVNEIIEFDGLPLTRELYQIYLQGYIASTESYENLLARFKAFHAHRYSKHAYLMDNDVRTIFEHWFDMLGLDISGASGSPFRMFVKAIGPQKNPKKPEDPPKLRDHSRLYRWYTENKKPQSINELVRLDDIVKEIASKGGGQCSAQ